jgi:spore coat protein A
LLTVLSRECAYQAPFPAFSLRLFFDPFLLLFYQEAHKAMLTRRHILKLGALAGVGMLTPTRWLAHAAVARAFSQSTGLRKFAQPLRGVGPGNIPVAAPDGTPAPVTGVTHYTLDINQFTDRLHPDQDYTTLRGYQPTVALGGGVQPQKHLGGIIVAKKDKPVQITFRNNLDGDHPIPVDPTIMGAEMGANRVATHFHGGLVPWISDGGPFAWWDKDGNHGESFVNNQVLNPNAAKNEAEFYYPNGQSARMGWYHDHAVGITRINAYAGIASAYIIRDDFEGNLRNLGLPDFIENGGRELPIVVQDKIFVNADTIEGLDPTWPGPRTTGSLWYPHVYEPDRWELEPGHPAVGDPSIVPEMFGDTMMANGTVYPEATVEARRYRLRILNACQARFLNLQMYVEDGSPDGITLNSSFAPTNAKGPDWMVIGTEGGFLVRPVIIPGNKPFSPMTLTGSLVTAPGERFDVIVDFKGFAGKNVILYNDAPAPFPMGDPSNDYFPGAPDNPTQPNPGFGPNTRQIMRFKVVPPTSADPPMRINTNTPLILGITPLLSIVGKPIVRQLTLNESFDEFGRLAQFLGTNVRQPDGTFAQPYLNDATEVAKNGRVEVWQIANLTGDTHPVHFHLVNVLLLTRRPFNVATYNGTPTYTGPARGPYQWEVGWKETVQMHPGEVTTVIMRVDLPRVPFSVPSSPRTGGNEYVWHCHILEHEEHDMMRPFVVG